MDFRRWSDCPPRAPLARTDALYGSHDHIVLLIGRIADFIYRDRERKIKQVEAWGGQWRPTPGIPGIGGMGPPPPRPQGQGGPPVTPTTPMGPPPHMQGMGPPPGWTGGPPPGWNPQASSSGPSQGGPPPQQTPRGPPPAAGPGFYGMAPAQPAPPLPSTYANPEQRTLNNPLHSEQAPQTLPASHASSRFQDLPAAYKAALADWNAISTAHATIASILSSTPSFAPLTPDLYPPVPGSPSSNNDPRMTPFGPALMHRSYDISIIWCMLHLAQILLLRAHPGMPPAAMVAASVSASATQPYAILIGRISAGLQLPMSEDVPLTPALGAALIEATMSLFFAGIQYQDAKQRDWLITRLLAVDRRTGWASAGVIARSCETSWEKAAEAGKGAPYPQRKTRRFGEEGPIALDPEPGSGWGGGGKAGGMSMDGVHDESGETRYVFKSAARTTVPWAMNILSTDEDLSVGMGRVGLSGAAAEQGDNVRVATGVGTGIWRDGV